MFFHYYSYDHNRDIEENSGEIMPIHTNLTSSSYRYAFVRSEEVRAYE